MEFAAAGQQVSSFASTLEAARTLAEHSEVDLGEGAMTFTEALEATRALREVEEGLASAVAALNGAVMVSAINGLRAEELGILEVGERARSAGSGPFS